MLWHSKFVITNLLGISVGWGRKNAPPTAPPGRRPSGGIGATRSSGWSGARSCGGSTPAFWWFTPVLAGMVLSIPLSVLTSRSSLGGAPAAGPVPDAGGNLAAVRTGHTPGPHRPPEKQGAVAPLPPDASLAEAVLDPYVNAIHVSLLREKRLNPEYTQALAGLGVGSPAVRELAERMLSKGPESIGPQEKILVLSDAEVMSWLHRQAWIRSSETLSYWWQTAIRQYAR